MGRPTKAKPIVKWVGGKRGILNELVSAMPENYGDYWEPFAGGAALFFEVNPAAQGHVSHLGDVNDDLIVTYKAVKSARKRLMEELDALAAQHSEEFYYEVRSRRDVRGYVNRAARFIFINKTGYNGLIRYNSKGQINTPWGHKDNPVYLYDEDNLKACSSALQGVELVTASYRDANPSEGDFVYFDPPYDDTYNGYSKSGFGIAEQESLAAFCRELDEAGVYWLLSNSDTPLIRELYDGFHVRVLTAPRAVSCKGDGRKPVREVLVSNYER